MYSLVFIINGFINNMDLFIVYFIFVCIIILFYWIFENCFMGNIGVFMEDFGYVVFLDNFWYYSFVIDILMKVLVVVC